MVEMMQILGRFFESGPEVLNLSYEACSWPTTVGGLRCGVQL
jgi:hypothetical protein